MHVINVINVISFARVGLRFFQVLLRARARLLAKKYFAGFIPPNDKAVAEFSFVLSESSAIFRVPECSSISVDDSASQACSLNQKTCIGNFYSETEAILLRMAHFADL